MLKRVYMDNLAECVRKNVAVTAILFLIGLLATASIVSSIYAVTHQKTVIAPPGGITEEIVVEGNKVSESYLLQFSRAIFDLGLEYTPNNAASQFQTLLLWVHPRSYEKYKAKFDEEIKDIEVGQINSIFVVDGLEHNEADKIIRATGKRMILLDNNKIVDTQRETHALKYDVKAGQFRWVDFGKWAEIKE